VITVVAVDEVAPVVVVEGVEVVDPGPAALGLQAAPMIADTTSSERRRVERKLDVTYQGYDPAAAGLGVP
jgi:hypothetical protein